MIISDQKPFEEIAHSLKASDSIFVVGCGDCATSCATGGEKEVAQLAEKLAASGKTITGTAVIATGCDERLVKRDLKKSSLTPEDAVLVLACGSGVQAVNSVIDNYVVPGLNSLFLGKIKNLSTFDKVCSMCGECVLAKTGNICPVTRCPKHLLNGPCGGSSEGKCEVNRNNDCAWFLIYERLKKLDKLSFLNSYQPPKDNSKNNIRTRFNTERKS
ncbi:MAG: 5,10-methylenetetrahydrofolate reductase [Candidatus Margulisiibacteriota bacterium]|nr:MAG: hypothetical protein A2X43_11430 [Candidatus Margulisbacteria bacterium GWD2_39_127]OGI03726.1 MAG: hypothetical protein A2X42_06630 [Candidatus Margulisbacteria bacterium GWF2_38_17]OGI06846.1 MAG: hypothetical protein A2X41_12650 [Candidatus Margulisbacteria bacterium GWE2_39_32]PZM77059.1 MAG: 5,10-methylenetetrahydrofolate reductase [Candidatus Margulisiibacteriota bacterium]HAR64441.1 5,10-methylenetetrahydrofolate reductase [Candidatus Margulisiibacteriota bacterium]